MIVITGPNGNVGQELIKLLLREPASASPFRIAARNPDKIDRLYGRHVPRVKFDFADRSTWDDALDGVSALFLLFPLPHPRTARSWMVPFVKAAANAGVKHIVYVSVPGADRLKVVPHHTVEAAIKASGVPYTILRAAYFSQNLIRDITTHAVDILDNDEVFIPAGKGLTSFVDSRDVAAVARSVLADPAAHVGQEYVLTGPERLGFADVAEMLTQELGRPIRYSNPSLPRFWTRMWRRGRPWDVIGFMTIVYLLTRFGRNAPMTDTLPGLLGRPATPIGRFIHDYRHRWQPDAGMTDLHPALAAVAQPPAKMAQTAGLQAPSAERTDDNLRKIA